ncbi:collagen binding domain-containing protein [uncultured Oscillibacter sp.]|uniref:MSCRAMM family protein n=1 Tax=uncultured Oscillibacter sp. TaxID=876091 RepID=UPI0025E30DE7|nr:SpaA isopeptide-forming pilin-related protein [uncultured Oscillibacter sp.]
MMKKLYRVCAGRRFFALALAAVMVLALLPSAGAAGWDTAIAQSVVDDANDAARAFSGAFAFTGYRAPEGQEETPVSERETGTLAVSADGTAPVELSLPAGTYTLEWEAGWTGPEGGALPETVTVRAGEETGLAYAGAAPSGPDLADFMTSYTLALNGGEPMDVDGGLELTGVQAGDKITVTGSFDIPLPGEAGFRAGEAYTIDLPAGLTYSRTASAAIYDEGGKKIAVFSLDAVNNTGTLRFEESFAPETYSHLSGNFSFNGVVAVPPGGEDGELSFTVAGHPVIVPIIWAETAAEVKKSGAMVSYSNNSVVRWTVTVQPPNKSGVFPAGLTVTDHMSRKDAAGPDIHELRKLESVKIGESTLSEKDYTLTDTGSGFILTLNREFEGASMKLVFTSNLSDAGLESLGSAVNKQLEGIRVHNHVSVAAAQEGGFDGETISWGQADAAMVTTVNLLQKTYVKQEWTAEGTCQVWRLFINKNHMSLDAGTVIMDTLPQGLTFDSAVFYRHKGGDLTKIGSYTREDDLFETDASSEGEVSFTLREDIDVPMVIEVKTSGEVPAGGATNRASMTVENTTFTSQATTGTGASITSVYKQGAGYNLKNRTAQWNVYVGPTDGAAMLSDTLEAEKQTLIAADAALQAEFTSDAMKYISIQRIQELSPGQVAETGKATLAGSPIYLDLSGGTKSGTLDGVTFTAAYSGKTLTVETDGPLAHVYRVQFHVRVADNVIYGTIKAPGGNKPIGRHSGRNLTNEAVLTVGGKTYTSKAALSNSNSNFDKNTANPSMAAQTISWKLRANQQGLSYRVDDNPDSENYFLIQDRLPAGLFFKGAEDVTLNPSAAKLEAAGYTVDIRVDDSGTQMDIVIRSATGEKIFNQSVTATVVSHITDEAVQDLLSKGDKSFRNNGYQRGVSPDGKARWEGDYEDITLKTTPVSKNASYNPQTGMIDWSITVNPSHLPVLDMENGVDLADQLTVTGLTSGTLTPADLVEFSTGSLVITRKAAGGASTTIVPQAVEGTAPATGSYYRYDPETLQLELHIDVSGGAASDTYTIKYATLLNIPEGYTGNDTVTVDNKVGWSGHSGGSKVTNIDLAGVNVGLDITKFGALTVHKADAVTNQALKGAVFALYQVTNGVAAQEPLTTAVTQSNGDALFQRLIPGEYLLVEMTAPAGYRISAQAGAGIGVTIQAGHTAEETVKNQPILGRIVVTKVGPGSTGGTVLLPGAAFRLLAEDQETTVRPAQVTDERGQTAFENLPMGTYYLQETAAPDGYVLSGELIPVVLQDNGTETIAVNRTVTNLREETPPPVGPVDPVDPDTPPVDPNTPPVDPDTPPVDPDTPPVDPDTPTPPPDRPSTPGDRDDDDDDVILPGDLTPGEVEDLLENGKVPLSDIPDLTPEEIIEQNIPLVDLPDLEVPRAGQPGIPATGDDTPVELLAAGLLAALGGLFLLYRKPRRSETRRH